MIILKTKDSKRIEALHPHFKTLFDYVKNHDLSQVEPGRIEINGTNLFINVDEPTLMTKEEQKMEVHRKYIDIHFPISGQEIIGWRALSDIHIEPEEPFNEEKDFAFYKIPASTYITVKPGECVVLYPEDAHAPIIGEGKLRKLVAKIRI